MLVALVEYRQEHDSGGQVDTAPLDVAFGDVVLQPDVFWLPRPAPRRGLPIAVPPLLVVEVSSPSPRGHDLVRKRRIYERAGVPEYLFVDDILGPGRRRDTLNQHHAGVREQAVATRSAGSP